MLKKWIVKTTFVFFLTIPLGLSHAQIIVAVFDGARPVLFINEEGKADGFYPQLLREIFPEEDLDFITNISFQEAYNKAVRGEIDILPALIKTPEREKDLFYSQEPAMTSWSEVFVQRNTVPLRSVLDLRDSTIALMEGGQNGKSSQKLMSDFDISFTPLYFNDFTAMTEAVLKGDANGMVSFNSFILSEPRLQPLGIVFAPTQSYFATSTLKGRQSLSVIDEHLESWKADPDSPYFRALESWFLIETVQKTPSWVKPLLISTTSVLILIFVILILQYFHIKRVMKISAEQEKKLSEKEQQYSLYLKNTNDLIWAMNTEKKITFINEKALLTMEIDKSSWKGKEIHSLFSKKDSSYIDAILKEIFKGKSRLYEVGIRCKEGELRNFSVKTDPVFDNGNLLGAISFARDITEIKKLELQLQRSQRMDALGSLTGTIAHDFNNLLTPIIGYAELSKMMLEDTHKIHNQLDNILQAGLKARELTKQLLTFSKKTNINRQSVDLNDMIESFFPILKKSVSDGISIILDTYTQLPQIEADPGLLEQVLLNLVVNASDAIKKEGEIVISTCFYEEIAAESLQKLDISPGPYCAVSVKDTGEGIKQEIMDRLFEPLFSTKGEKGTGLGLSSSFGIVKQHRGAIEVASEPGEGSTFTFYLPAELKD